jgi:hypothetical protein
MEKKKDPIVIRDPEDFIIKAVKDDKSHPHGKVRLYLDVDGTLVAMYFDPDYMKDPEGP